MDGYLFKYLFDISDENSGFELRCRVRFSELHEVDGEEALSFPSLKLLKTCYVTSCTVFCFPKCLPLQLNEWFLSSLFITYSLIDNCIRDNSLNLNLKK